MQLTTLPKSISKAQFKPRLLAYLRLVEEKKQPLIITHHKKPVIKVMPIQTENDETKTERIMKKLRGSIVYYKDPDKPVGLEDWELLP